MNLRVVEREQKTNCKFYEKRRRHRNKISPIKTACPLVGRRVLINHPRRNPDSCRLDLAFP